MIQHGKAQYVAMIHDDDRWDPDFLERRVQFLDKNPTCGFVFGGSRLIDRHGKAIALRGVGLTEGTHRPASIIPELYEYNIVGAPTMLVRRAAYESVGAEFRALFFTDHEMVLRLAANFDVGFVEVCDSDYRMHERQHSVARRLEWGHGHLEVIEATEDLPIPAAIRRRAIARAHLACALDDVERGQRGQAIDHVRIALRSNPWLVLRLGALGRILVIIGALAFGGFGRSVFTKLRMRRFAKRESGLTQLK